MCHRDSCIKLGKVPGDIVGNTCNANAINFVYEVCNRLDARPFLRVVVIPTGKFLNKYIVRLLL